MKRRGGAEETDDEVSATPEARTNRRKNLATLLEEIEVAKRNIDARPKAMYQPDKESMAYMASYFLHPNLKQYEGYRELSDAGKKDFREQIMQGGGTIKGVRVAETVALYSLYF